MACNGQRGDLGQSDVAQLHTVSITALGRFLVRIGGVHVPDHKWKRRHRGAMFKALERRGRRCNGATLLCPVLSRPYLFWMA